MSENESRTTDNPTETATFGAGCFWKPEMVFKETPGVVGTAVGYEGGHVENPTYEQVCTGTTGHAEVTRVEFDPEVISYGELVEKFWEIHDPTQVDRQGPDVGSQYRSVIFFQDPEQERIARESKARVEERLSAPVATSVEPTTGFWRAEEYHQCYLERRRPANALRSLIGH
jgi:peptide-methionine (S)-S-oxide reductase